MLGILAPYDESLLETRRTFTLGRKTRSMWGAAPSRYYRWLNNALRESDAQSLRLAVLGCSDGKFVLPAARRGVETLAMDIDPISLFGGEKVATNGQPIYMPGLHWRLETEGLANRVNVILGDLATTRVEPPCDLVFISGALQYSVNLQHTMANMIASVKSCVAPGGRLYIEYMLPLEERHKGLDNYPDQKTWHTFFSGDGWRITSHRITPAGIDRRRDLQIFAKHKYAQWGHLMAERIT